jgi:hypothetical protein
MSREFQGERIEVLAADPRGDLACDFTIANEKEREGLPQALSAGMISPVREIADGVEVRFRPDAWDTVQRYIELESRCCSFLTLAADRDDDGVRLRVTGRPDAVPVIRSIFS